MPQEWCKGVHVEDSASLVALRDPGGHEVPVEDPDQHRGISKRGRVGIGGVSASQPRRSSARSARSGGGSNPSRFFSSAGVQLQVGHRAVKVDLGDGEGRQLVLPQPGEHQRLEINARSRPRASSRIPAPRDSRGRAVPLSWVLGGPPWRPAGGGAAHASSSRDNSSGVSDRRLCRGSAASFARGIPTKGDAIGRRSSEEPVAERGEHRQVGVPGPCPRPRRLGAG